LPLLTFIIIAGFGQKYKSVKSPNFQPIFCASCSSRKLGSRASTRARARAAEKAQGLILAPDCLCDFANLIHVTLVPLFKSKMLLLGGVLKSAVLGVAVAQSVGVAPFDLKDFLHCYQFLSFCCIYYNTKGLDCQALSLLSLDYVVVGSGMTIAESVHKIVFRVDFGTAYDAMGEGHSQVCGHLLNRILRGDHVTDFGCGEHFTHRQQGEIVTEGSSEFSVSPRGTKIFCDGVHVVFSPLLF